MKRFALTLPSLLASRRPGSPRQPSQAAAVGLPRSRQRELTGNAASRLDRAVAEARRQARAEIAQRYATICRLCDRLGQPHLASQLIGDGATIEQAVTRLCGRATDAAHFPNTDH